MVPAAAVLESCPGAVERPCLPGKWSDSRAKVPCDDVLGTL